MGLSVLVDHLDGDTQLADGSFDYSADVGRFIEERTWVEDMEHLGVGMEKAVASCRVQVCEDARQLTPSGAVECLEKPPMSAGRQSRLVVGKPGPPVAAEHPYRQVLVNDDHLSTLARISPQNQSLRRRAADQPRSLRPGRPGALEVFGGQTAQQRSIRVGKARVTGLPVPTACLQQLLTDAHLAILPP